MNLDMKLIMKLINLTQLNLTPASHVEAQLAKEKKEEKN